MTNTEEAFLDLVSRLGDWDTAMGTWDSPVWEDVRRFRSQNRTRGLQVATELYWKRQETQNDENQDASQNDA